MNNKYGEKKTMVLESDYSNKATLHLNDYECNYDKRTLFLEQDILDSGIRLDSPDTRLLNGKYKILSLLTDDSGEADIYVGEYNNEKYIVKLYRSKYQHNDEKIKRIKSIKSPYVIKIIDEGKYLDRFFEVMPFYKNGDISRYKLSEKFVKDVVVNNLIDALKGIHECKLIHRDIKPSNIFLSDDKSHVILGDFGISSVLGEKVTSKKTGKAKTLEYSAIETFNDIVTNASDYYSLGVTIMEILTGRTSYEGLTDMEITKRKSLNQFEIPLDKGTEFYRLIKGLTNFSASNRWQYDEVKRWINGEYVEIIEDKNDMEMNRPYKFNGKSLTSRKDLALELALNWNDGKKNFIRGYLSDYFKSIDQELACKIEDFVQIVNSNQSVFDTEYFKAIYTIYPEMELIWCGEKLGDVKSVVNKMQLSSMDKNQSYCDLVFKGALKYYLEINKASKASIETIDSLMQMSKAFYKKAYYSFLLIDNSDFHYRGQVLSSINDLIVYISNNIENGEIIAEELEKSEYFDIWMKKLGFVREFEEYLQLINK